MCVRKDDSQQRQTKFLIYESLGKIKNGRSCRRSHKQNVSVAVENYGHDFHRGLDRKKYFHALKSKFISPVAVVSHFSFGLCGNMAIPENIL